jgi:hypothetical protein
MEEIICRIMLAAALVIFFILAISPLITKGGKNGN